MLVLYVDVLFLTGEDKLIEDARRILSTKFEMKELGMVHYSLGIEMWQNADGIFLGQGKYAVEIMNKLGMLDHKVIATPMASNMKLLCDASLDPFDAMLYRQIVGPLMYLTNTR